MKAMKKLAKQVERVTSRDDVKHEIDAAREIDAHVIKARDQMNTKFNQNQAAINLLFPQQMATLGAAIQSVRDTSETIHVAYEGINNRPGRADLASNTVKSDCQAALDRIRTVLEPAFNTAYSALSSQIDDLVVAAVAATAGKQIATSVQAKLAASSAQVQADRNAWQPLVTAGHMDAVVLQEFDAKLADLTTKHDAIQALSVQMTAHATDATAAVIKQSCDTLLAQIKEAQPAFDNAATTLDNDISLSTTAREMVQADLAQQERNAAATAFLAARRGGAATTTETAPAADPAYFAFLRTHNFSTAAADINKANSSFHTPLTKAVRENNLETAKALVAAGADFNQENAVGNTPAHIAIDKKFDAIVLWLIHGLQADLNHRNQAGETAADIARRTGYELVTSGLPAVNTAATPSARV